MQDKLFKVELRTIIYVVAKDSSKATDTALHNIRNETDNLEVFLDEVKDIKDIEHEWLNCIPYSYDDSKDLTCIEFLKGIANENKSST